MVKEYHCILKFKIPYNTLKKQNKGLKKQKLTRKSKTK